MERPIPPAELSAAGMAALLRALTGLPEERVRHDGHRLLLDPDTVSELLPVLVAAFAALALLAALLLHVVAAPPVPVAFALALAALLAALRLTVARGVSEFDLLDRDAGAWLRVRELAGRRAESLRFPLDRVTGLAVKVAERVRADAAAGGHPHPVEAAIRRAHDEGGHVHGDANEARPVAFESRYAIYARMSHGADFLLIDLQLSDFERSRAAAEALAAWLRRPLLD